MDEASVEIQGSHKPATRGVVGLVVALLLSLSASITIGYTLLQYYDRENTGWNIDSLEYLDHYYGEPVRAIVRYRVLTIWLVRALPDLPVNLFSAVRADNPDWQAILKFAFVNTLALAATGLVLYLFQLHLGLNIWLSLLGTMSFFLLRPIVQGTTVPMVDALHFLTWILTIYAITSVNWWLLIVSFVLGLLAKETIMLATVFVILANHPVRQKAVQFLIIIAVSVAYILLRSTLFPGAKDTYNFNLNVINLWVDNLRAVLSIRGLFDLFTSFSFLWLLFVYAYAKGIVLSKIKYLWLSVPILLAAIVALSGNLGRTMVMAFPVVIPAAMMAIGHLLPLASSDSEAR
jgi:hypothetical protein